MIQTVSMIANSTIQLFAMHTNRHNGLDYELIGSFEKTSFDSLKLMAEFANGQTHPVSEAAAYLLFVPLSIPAEEALSHIILNGKACGIQYYREIEEIHLYLSNPQSFQRAASGEIYTLAMWKDFYMQLAEEISTRLEESSLEVSRHFADETSQEELVDLLTSNPCKNLVMYFGHGRSRGWSGYRGIRWSHFQPVIQERPMVGNLISFTCDNLKSEHNRIPFGVQWVLEGKAHSFFGTTDSVKIFPMKRICHMTADLISQGSCQNIGELVVGIDKQIKKIDRQDLSECWSKFRLIGSPMTTL